MKLPQLKNIVFIEYIKTSINIVDKNTHFNLKNINTIRHR